MYGRIDSEIAADRLEVKLLSMIDVPVLDENCAHAPG